MFAYNQMLGLCAVPSLSLDWARGQRHSTAAGNATSGDRFVCPHTQVPDVLLLHKPLFCGGRDVRSRPCGRCTVIARCTAAWGQRSAAALPHSVRLPAVRKKVCARRYLGEGLLNNVVFVMASTIITGFISFTFFGLNAIGMEIEDPFGDDDNDLDL